MKIDVRKAGISDDKWKTVTVSDGGTTIELPWIEKEEAHDLAENLREAAFNLDRGEGKEYLRPGLEKALELVKDYLSALQADKRINEALWVDVVREHIKDELESL